MKRFFIFFSAVLQCVTSAMAADVMPQDSLRTYAVDAIEVVAVRADDSTIFLLSSHAVDFIELLFTTSFIFSKGIPLFIP